MIMLCFENILEGAEVTLQSGTALEGFPLYRLFDRNTKRLFKSAYSQVVEIKISAPSEKQIDRLIIPEGHNLSGRLITLFSSADDTAYEVIDSFSPDSNLINRALRGSKHRFYKLRIENNPDEVAIPELFLTYTYIWETNPPERLSTEFLVERLETSSGEARFLIEGGARRKRQYQIRSAWQRQKEELSYLIDSWQGAKPFYLCDHEGAWIYGGLERPIEIKKTGYDEYSFVFDFIELT